MPDTIAVFIVEDEKLARQINSKLGKGVTYANLMDKAKRDRITDAIESCED
ncbi:MAG: hypothetical protein M0R37_14960 [Bacteroidales bacterium]|jgi:hypothetical protein|nr:hypothetical protein [Bacteroidales bacterium]